MESVTVGSGSKRLFCTNGNSTTKEESCPAKEPRSMCTIIIPTILKEKGFNWVDRIDAEKSPLFLAKDLLLHSRNIHQDFFDFLYCNWLALEYCVSWYTSDAVSLEGFTGIFRQLAAEVRFQVN